MITAPVLDMVEAAKPPSTKWQMPLWIKLSAAILIMYEWAELKSSRTKENSGNIQRFMKHLTVPDQVIARKYLLKYCPAISRRWYPQDRLLPK